MVDKIKKVLMLGLLSVASSAYSMETLIDFDDQNTGEFSQLTVQGATFSIDDGVGSIAMSNYNYDTEKMFSGGVLVLEGSGAGGALTISFEEPIRSLSFDILSPSNWTLSAYDSFDQPIESISSSADKAFARLSSSESDITYAKLVQDFSGLTPDSIVILFVDNVTYSDVSPVPEPSTYALMLGGLGLVGFMAYRRKKVLS